MRNEKSCCQHVGKTTYTDQSKMKIELSKLKEAHLGEYYPLEQLHLDTCEMDSRNIYGNLYFAVIVDRATDFFWHLPLKNKAQFYKRFEVFIEVVLNPFLAKHGTRMQRMLSRISLLPQDPA